MSVVFSCLRSFVLLIASLGHVVHAAFSFRPANSTCVWTERQLRKVIAQASNETRTRITLCRQNISISNTRTQYDATGIVVTDRFVDIRCNLKRSKGLCTLDGGYSSRIFVGERADLSVRNVLFTNTLPDDCSGGGVINLDTSNITFTGCSFMNNGNDTCFGTSIFPSGGAISVFDSMLTISGGSTRRPVIFSDNKGRYGGSINAFRSEVSIGGYTVFSKNSGEYGGAVHLRGSTFNIKNVKFQANVGNMGSAIYFRDSQSTMNNVEFLGNDGVVIKARKSKISLKNSTFSSNMSNDDGSNIYIEDDNDPLEDGTFVKCQSYVVFCNGISEDSIDEFSFDNTTGNFSNTDCNTKGLEGTPGKGSCPI